METSSSPVPPLPPSSRPASQRLSANGPRSLSRLPPPPLDAPLPADSDPLSASARSPRKASSARDATSEATPQLRASRPSSGVKRGVASSESGELGKPPRFDSPTSPTQRKARPVSYNGGEAELSARESSVHTPSPSLPPSRRPLPPTPTSSGRSTSAPTALDVSTSAFSASAPASPRAASTAPRRTQSLRLGKDAMSPANDVDGGSSIVSAPSSASVTPRMPSVGRLEHRTSMRSSRVQNHLSTAKLLADNKSFEDAVAQLDIALSLKPELSSVVKFHSSRANYNFKAGKIEEAVLDYARAAALEGAPAELFFNRGNALLALKRGGEALESFTRATTLDPRLFEAHIMVARLAIRQPGNQEAMVALNAAEKALALQPKHITAHDIRVRALERLKRSADAFESAMVLAETNLTEKRRVALAHVLAAVAKKHGGEDAGTQRSADALTAARMAVDLKADYTTCYALSQVAAAPAVERQMAKARAIRFAADDGAALIAQGSYEEALLPLKRGLKLSDAEDAEILYLVGFSLYNTCTPGFKDSGKREVARELFEACVRLDPGHIRAKTFCRLLSSPISPPPLSGDSTARKGNADGATNVPKPPPGPPPSPPPSRGAATTVPPPPPSPPPVSRPAEPTPSLLPFVLVSTPKEGSGTGPAPADGTAASSTAPSVLGSLEPSSASRLSRSPSLGESDAPTRRFSASQRALSRGIVSGAAAARLSPIYRSSEEITTSPFEVRRKSLSISSGGASAEQELNNKPSSAEEAPLSPSTPGTSAGLFSSPAATKTRLRLDAIGVLSGANAVRRSSQESSNANASNSEGASNPNVSRSDPSSPSSSVASASPTGSSGLVSKMRSIFSRSPSGTPTAASASPRAIDSNSFPASSAALESSLPSSTSATIRDASPKRGALADSTISQRHAVPLLPSPRSQASVPAVPATTKTSKVDSPDVVFYKSEAPTSRTIPAGSLDLSPPVAFTAAAFLDEPRKTSSADPSIQRTPSLPPVIPPRPKSLPRSSSTASSRLLHSSPLSSGSRQSLTRPPLPANGPPSSSVGGGSLKLEIHTGRTLEPMVSPMAGSMPAASSTSGQGRPADLTPRLKKADTAPTSASAPISPTVSRPSSLIFSALDLSSAQSKLKHVDPSTVEKRAKPGFVSKELLQVQKGSLRHVDLEAIAIHKPKSKAQSLAESIANFEKATLRRGADRELAPKQHENSAATGIADLLLHKLAQISIVTREEDDENVQEWDDDFE